MEIGSSHTNPRTIYFQGNQLRLDINDTDALFGTPTGYAKYGYWRAMLFNVSQNVRNNKKQFYDSGWMQVSCNANQGGYIVFEHNFGVTPQLVQVFYTNDYTQSGFPFYFLFVIKKLNSNKTKNKTIGGLIYPYVRWYKDAPAKGPQSIIVNPNDVTLAIENAEDAIISTWLPSDITGTHGYWTNATMGYFRILALSDIYLLNSTFIDD